jgi:tRNA dimethylallyltransferase
LGFKSIPIPIIVGATGTGKTLVALALSRFLGGEVISADSRQVYRHLSVGTGRPRGVWKNNSYLVDGVSHHLMDILEPTEIYNAGLFSRQGRLLIGEILKKSRVPLVVGGTGLYIRALVDGLTPLPERDDVLRRALTLRAEKEGREALHRELGEVDPVAAATIAPNNLSRVLRALEVYRLTGKPLSLWHRENQQSSPYSFRWFGLRWPKEELETHLAKRCRAMVRGGLVEETKALLAQGVSRAAPAFQSLGYGFALDYLQGRLTRDELEERFFRQTRLYVKRQNTWFRAEKRIQWIDTHLGDSPLRLADAICAALE